MNGMNQPMRYGRGQVWQLTKGHRCKCDVCVQAHARMRAKAYSMDRLIGEELRLQDPDAYVRMVNAAMERRPASVARAEDGRSW